MVVQHDRCGPSSNNVRIMTVIAPAEWKVGQFQPCSSVDGDMEK